MRLSRRPYNHSEDFQKVGQFLVETYRPGTQHDNWLQPRWEYMHYHPDLDESALARIGLWESDGKLAAVANYEGKPGETFFQVHPKFRFLITEMLEYAEKNLSVRGENGQSKIAVWINDFDTEFESIAQARGYRRVIEAKESWSIFEIRNLHPGIKLPAGFRLQSLADENDLKKLDRLIYRGFNHPGEPPDDGVLGKQKMQSAPGYRKDLNIVAVSANGTYCSYCGMWLELTNRIAYVEPVCTDPDFRRRGLGAAAVLEGIRRCGLEGARIAMVGSDQPFYLALGFKKLFGTNLWARSLG